MENDNKALTLCKIRNVKLPYPEQAKNLGEGQWLITASNPHFKMRISTNEGRGETKQLTGCQACIVRIPCGGKLVTNFLSLQADSASCKNLTVLKMDMVMAEPLRHLIESLPPLGELPHQPNIETAETSLIEEVQNRMARSPSLTPEFTNEKIDAIARPIIQSYRELQKPIADNVGGTLKSHISISVTITSFVVAILCQILFHWAKPYLPFMRGTKVGTITQEELDRMSLRKMKYHRIIFYETPDRTLNAVTNTKEGFKHLAFAEIQKRKGPREGTEKKDEEKQIEDSPDLTITESST